MHGEWRVKLGVLALGPVLGLAVGACKNSGSGGLIDRGSCDTLLACVEGTAAYDEYVDVYGAGGQCWLNGDFQACRDFCQTTLDALNLAAEAAGQEPCGWCETDADCASFGAGATCDQGVCVGGSGEQGESEGDSESEGETGPSPNASNDVDVLFVVDNSGSMGEEQAQLALAVDRLVDQLEGAGADYRIAFTTSDNGNPWCPAGTTTPEGGNFVLSPCTSRLNDFLFGDTVDVRELACTDICDLDAGDLEIQPTTTDVDPNPQPRAWLENIAGAQNLPSGTDMGDALRCFLPQGVNGCGFESQLESMYLGLIRASTAGEDNYGFMRAGSVLAVVFLTDEADCSYNKDYASIFDQAGNKVFWSDPNASFPTSAVCWNAGVSCVGGPTEYASCDAVNKDINGNEGVADSEAVLHPMSRYTDRLAAIEADIQTLAPGREVVFGLIAGLQSDGTPHYENVDATDPGFQNSFGIGPGCTAPNPFEDPGDPDDDFVEAVPPVRMLEVAESTGRTVVHSICDQNFDPAVDAIAAEILDQLPQ